MQSETSALKQGVSPLDVGKHCVEGTRGIQVSPAHEVAEAAIVEQRDVTPRNARREQMPRLHSKHQRAEPDLPHAQNRVSKTTQLDLLPLPLRSSASRVAETGDGMLQYLVTSPNHTPFAFRGVDSTETNDGKADHLPAVKHCDLLTLSKQAKRCDDAGTSAVDEVRVQD